MVQADSSSDLPMDQQLSSSQSQAIVEHCSCPVCFEIYEHNKHTPLSLHCGHSLCIECIRSISSHHEFAELECPICKTKTPGTQTQLLSLPKNYSLLSVLETTQLSSENKLHSCISCKDRFLQKYLRICAKCYPRGELICTSCAIDGHNGHKLIKYDEELFKARAECKERLKVVENMLESAKETCKEKTGDLIAVLNRLVEHYDEFKLPSSLAEEADRVLVPEDVNELAETADSLAAEFERFVQILGEKMDAAKDAAERQLELFDMKEMPADMVGMLERKGVDLSELKN